MVTDVVDGPLGANASETRKDQGKSFPIDKVGNTGPDDSGWVLDDLLSSGTRSGQADRPAAEALTFPVRKPAWASRRMGAAAPVTPAVPDTRPAHEPLRTPDMPPAQDTLPGPEMPAAP